MSSDTPPPDWAVLTPRERDLLVAEHVMGYRRATDDTRDYAGTRHGGEVLVPPGETLASLREWLPRRGDIPFGYFVTEEYTRSPTAARAVEDAIARRQLYADYCGALAHLVGLDDRELEDYGRIALWPIIAATPEQRCRAALMAVGVLPMPWPNRQGPGPLLGYGRT